MSNAAMIPRLEALKQHCWECRRRRLVCDSTMPACTRCRKALVTCPGYGKNKPLRWLQPGQITSSSARQLLASSQKRKTIDGKEKGYAGSTSGGNQSTDTDLSLDFITELGTLRIEDYKAVQVICYYNSHVFPLYASTLRLVPRLHIFELTWDNISIAPSTMHHILACWALGHRIHQLPQDVCPRVLSCAWATYYSHRGESIRTLTAGIGHNDPVKRTMAMLNLAIFLFVEIEHGDPNWRLHHAGLSEMIRVLGGLEKWIKMPMVGRLIHHVVNIEIFGNATSPSQNQITSVPYATLVRIVSNNYDSVKTANNLCPSSLVLAMVHINHLRSSPASLVPGLNTPQLTPSELLEEINEFCPTSWADSIGSGEENLILLGRIYQSTVALYCILSLKSASRTDKSSGVGAQKVMHYKRLRYLLNVSVLSPEIKHFMLWPFVVFGVASGSGVAADRQFVSQQLLQYKQYLGQGAPMALKQVLEKFWDSRKSSWDDCFDQPYCFIA